MGRDYRTRDMIDDDLNQIERGVSAISEDGRVTDAVRVGVYAVRAMCALARVVADVADVIRE